MSFMDAARVVYGKWAPLAVGVLLALGVAAGAVLGVLAFMIINRVA